MRLRGWHVLLETGAGHAVESHPPTDRRGDTAMSIDIPNYRVVDTLGTGQGSTLYRAIAVATGQEYTIKYVKVQTPEDNRLVEQMKDEHACGSVLDHPTLRKTFELRLVKQRFRLKSAMLFMEFVDGVTLSDCGERLGLQQLLRVIEKAGEGLDAMHRGGFVHADLKPGNILILPNREVKLIDFGQSSPINKAKKRVQGTIDYMAPEQAARQVLDARTDVFGLGATLHRVLTGKPVATEMNQRVDIHSLGRVGVRLEDNLPPSLDDLPVVVRKLITDSCAQEPAGRPKSMREMIDRCRMAQIILARRTESPTAAVADATDLDDDSLSGEILD
jgi:serine/threonine protein kinase